MYIGVAVVRMSSVCWNIVILLASTTIIANQNIPEIVDTDIVEKKFFETLVAGEFAYG